MRTFLSVLLGGLFVAVLPLSAQWTWVEAPNDADTNLDDDWNDLNAWDDGNNPAASFPDAAGVTINLTVPVGGSADNLANVRQNGNFTVGIINAEDLDAGNTDWIIRSNNATHRTFTLDNSGSPAQINVLNTLGAGDFIRFSDTDGTNPLTIAGSGGIDILSSGRVDFAGGNTFTGTVDYKSLPSLNDPDGSAGQLFARTDRSFGAVGAGNETIVHGFGATVSTGDPGSEPSVRFDYTTAHLTAWNTLNPALQAGTTKLSIAEDFVFNWVPHNADGGGSRNWDNMFFVEDNDVVDLTGSIAINRLQSATDGQGNLITSNTTNQDVRVGEFQADPGATLNITGTITVTDTSTNTSSGNFRNSIGLNPVNAASSITVSAINYVDNGTNGRDFGLFKDGDGTAHLTGAINDAGENNGGEIRIQRGTVSVEHNDALSSMDRVRLGENGTNGTQAVEELNFYLNVNGTTSIDGTATTGQIVLNDIVGSQTDADAVGTAGGDALSYVIGSQIAGESILQFDELTYEGDGWDGGNNVDAGQGNNTQTLDSLNPIIDFNVSDPGGLFRLQGRIQGQDVDRDIVTGSDGNAGTDDPDRPLGLAEGSVTVNKIGAGTMVLGSTPNGDPHQYNGPTNVNAGALIVDAEVWASPLVTVASGATLGGSSTIGHSFEYQLNSNVGGTGGQASELRAGVASAVTFQSGSTFDPGSRDSSNVSQAGQLAVDGTVDFQGATLNYDLGAPDMGIDPSNSDHLNVIDQTGTNDVAAAATVAFSGSDSLVINALAGFGAGTYDLIDAAGGESGSGPIVTTAPSGYGYRVDQNGNDTSTVAGDINLSVREAADASFASASDLGMLTIDFGTVSQGSSPATQNFSIFNFVDTPAAGETLDMTTITPSGDTGVFSTDLATFLDLVAGGSNGFAADFADTSALGTFTANYVLDFDLDQTAGYTYFGGNTDQLTLTITGTVVPEPGVFGLLVVGASGILFRRRRVSPK